VPGSVSSDFIASWPVGPGLASDRAMSRQGR